jgi:hypothetical protein
MQFWSCKRWACRFQGCRRHEQAFCREQVLPGRFIARGSSGLSAQGRAAFDQAAGRRRRVAAQGAYRRVTAEMLYDEAYEAGCLVSRAAVCGALRQFEQIGLLCRIAIDQFEKSWFVVANDSDGVN